MKIGVLYTLTTRMPENLEIFFFNFKNIILNRLNNKFSLTVVQLVIQY